MKITRATWLQTTALVGRTSLTLEDSSKLKDFEFGMTYRLLHTGTYCYQSSSVDANTLCPSRHYFLSC